MKYRTLKQWLAAGGSRDNFRGRIFDPPLSDREIQERNLAIYQDRLSGMTFRDIGEKYSLTAPRVQQLYLRHKNRLDAAAWKP
jgi:hypothetical protein